VTGRGVGTGVGSSRLLPHEEGPDCVADCDIPSVTSKEAEVPVRDCGVGKEKGVSWSMSARWQRTDFPKAQSCHHLRFGWQVGGLLHLCLPSCSLPSPGKPGIQDQHSARQAEELSRSCWQPAIG
jgi:hypothetical protein